MFNVSGETSVVITKQHGALVKSATFKHYHVKFLLVGPISFSFRTDEFKIVCEHVTEEKQGNFSSQSEVEKYGVSHSSIHQTSSSPTFQFIMDGLL